MKNKLKNRIEKIYLIEPTPELYEYLYKLNSDVIDEFNFNVIEEINITKSKMKSEYFKFEGATAYNYDIKFNSDDNFKFTVNNNDNFDYVFIIKLKNNHLLINNYFESSILYTTPYMYDKQKYNYNIKINNEEKLFLLSDKAISELNNTKVYGLKNYINYKKEELEKIKKEKSEWKWWKW